MFYWLVGLLVWLLVSCLVGWLVGLLTCCLAGWLVGLLVVFFFGLLVNYFNVYKPLVLLLLGFCIGCLAVFVSFIVGGLVS